ncbi:MAG: PKD domain-containing protein [Pseudomonadota bacterium]
MRTLIPAAFILVFPVLMAGTCKPEGDDTSHEVLNNAPVANAGSDISQPADLIVTLDGHSSYDPDGDAIIFSWSFEHLPDGSELESREAPFARNHDATASTTTFQPDVLGTYVVKLIVRDAKGLNSAPDYVVVVAEEPEDRPVANAGPDQTITLGATATLDGTASYDPQGRPLTYTWSLVDTPTYSALTTASVSNPTEATASFVPDVKGVYIANLVVENAMVGSLPDATVVTVIGDNGAPTANAGEDISAEDCTAIPLDGSGSVDPDGDPLTYYWDLQAKPSGSTATGANFSGRDIASPTFFADVAGNYILSVAVYDNEEWSTPDLVNLTIAERSYNSSPSVNAGSDQGYKDGEVTCTAGSYGSYDCDDCDDISTMLGTDADITDPDGDPYTVQWTVIDGSATIHDPTSLETAVILTDITVSSLSCEDTAFTFELAVTDCTGETKTDQVVLTATCCGTE